MPDPLIYIFLFAFGATIGSFLNVCIHRLPEGKSIIIPSSTCPSCNTPIRWHDNIPIVSFLLLSGRCRFCKSPISIRYPLVEMTGGLLALGLFRIHGLTPAFFIYLVFTSALLVVTMIDLQHQVIPDVISLPGIALGVMASFLLSDITLYSSLFGAFLGGGILFLIASAYHWLTGREGMGGGDIKFLAMIGAFLGWKGVLVTIFTGSFAGAVIGMIAMVIQKRDARYAIPFGPFLAMGAIVYILFGEDLIEWYITLIT